MLQICSMTGRNSSKKKADSLDDNQQLLQKIGKRLKDLRVQAGYTSAEAFAWEHAFGRSQYSTWERGQDLKITSLHKLATAHKITLSELLEGIK